MPSDTSLFTKTNEKQAIIVGISMHDIPIAEDKALIYKL